MFKRSTLALATMAALLSHAVAADLVVKAPKAIAFANPCTVGSLSTPLSCSGFYVGGGLSGQGSNADIIGNGVNGSVFAGGIVPFVNAGYQYVQGNWLFAAEVDAGYGLASKVTVGTVGGSINGFRTTEFFKAGGNLAGLLGNQVPVTIPVQLANSVLGPYVGIGATQWKLPGAWANGMVSGAGVLFDISPRLFGDLRYTYTNFDSARAGGVIIQNDQALRVSINYKLN